MSRAPDPVFRAWVDAARAFPIGDFAQMRGLRLRGRVERVGACPDCGDGGKGANSDRFALNTHKGVFGCRRCGAGGDVVDLVQFIDRCDFLRACEILTGQSAPRGEGHGLDTEALANLERERAERRAAQAERAAQFRERERCRLFGLYRSGQRPWGTPVEDYLRLRGLTLPHDTPIRFGQRAPLYAPGNPGAGPAHAGPAMLSPILGPEGRFSGLHITWIDLAHPDGKAVVADPGTGEILPAKKVRGSKTGGHIGLTRIDPRTTTQLIIGEGIETTLSIREEMLDAGRPLAGTVFWSAVDLGNLGGPHAATVPHPTLHDRRGRRLMVPGPVPTGEGIPIPEGVRDIVILRDGDSEQFQVEQALIRATARWATPDRTVRVAAPPPGMDFNDLWRQGR